MLRTHYTTWFLKIVNNFVPIMVSNIPLYTRRAEGSVSHKILYRKEELKWDLQKD